MMAVIKNMFYSIKYGFWKRIVSLKGLETEIFLHLGESNRALFV